MAEILSEALPDVSQDRGRVIAKATINAARDLEMANTELARIIGVSPSTVSKMTDGGYSLSGKSFELAAYFVRIFRSLDAIAGGDRATMVGWMRNANSDLRSMPVQHMHTVAGLVDVMNYLDAQRAPL